MPRLCGRAAVWRTRPFFRWPERAVRVRLPLAARRAHLAAQALARSPRGHLPRALWRRRTPIRRRSRSSGADALPKLPRRGRPTGVVVGETGVHGIEACSKHLQRLYGDHCADLAVLAVVAALKARH